MTKIIIYLLYMTNKPTKEYHLHVKQNRFLLARTGLILDSTAMMNIHF